MRVCVFVCVCLSVCVYDVIAILTHTQVAQPSSQTLIVCLFAWYLPALHLSMALHTDILSLNYITFIPLMLLSKVTYLKVHCVIFYSHLVVKFYIAFKQRLLSSASRFQMCVATCRNYGNLSKLCVKIPEAMTTTCHVCHVVLLVPLGSSAFFVDRKDMDASVELCRDTDQKSCRCKIIDQRSKVLQVQSSKMSFQCLRDDVSGFCCLGISGDLIPPNQGQQTNQDVVHSVLLRVTE